MMAESLDNGTVMEFSLVKMYKRLMTAKAHLERTVHYSTCMLSSLHSHKLT